MKIRMLILGMMLCWSATAFAQPERFELSGRLGYQWGGIVDETTKDEGVDSLASALGIPGGVNFGIVANVWLGRSLQLELSWDQQPTQLNLMDRPNDDKQTKISDLKVNYYLAGLIYNWKKGHKGQPFLGGVIGVHQLVPDKQFETESGITFGPVFGYRTYTSRYFGIRLEARILLSNVPAGEMLYDATAGFGFNHTKDTWMTQIQFGIAIGTGW